MALIHRLSTKNTKMSCKTVLSSATYSKKKKGALTALFFSYEHYRSNQFLHIRLLARLAFLFALKCGRAGRDSGDPNESLKEVNSLSPHMFPQLENKLVCIC